MASGIITNNQLDDIVYDVIWDPKEGTMDLDDDPSDGNFDFEIDGAFRTISFLVWSGPNKLRVIAFGAAAVTSMELIQNSSDPNVRNTIGTLALVPQNMLTLV